MGMCATGCHGHAMQVASKGNPCAHTSATHVAAVEWLAHPGSPLGCSRNSPRKKIQAKSAWVQPQQPPQEDIGKIRLGAAEAATA